MSPTLARRAFPLVAALALCGCGRGYERTEQGWAWVFHNAAVGRGVNVLDADPGSFAVLDGGYARDRRSVWFEGEAVSGADAASFEVLDERYAKDRQAVYLETYPVDGADPATFEVLEFPYARDRADVYCGTVRLDVADPSTFRVVRGGDGTETTSLQYLLGPPELAEQLRARGVPPDRAIVLGTDGVGEADGVRYENALRVPAQ